MKAVVMSGFGPSNVFSTQEVPKPIPGPGQIRIRIKASGFNPVDWKIRSGWYGGTPPTILGMDCSGIVDAVGPDTSQFAVGEEVYAMSFFQSSGGSYAEYVCVPRELATRKPKNLTFEEAAATPLAAMTAYRATLVPLAFSLANIVFAVGLGGGVGSFAAQFLKKAGVREIFTTAKNEESAQFLQRQLAIPEDRIVLYQNCSTQQCKDLLLSLNGGRLFDGTLDLVGGETKRLCLELTGYSGHFSTIVPEKNFTFPFWEETAIPRARNLSVHQVAIGAEIGSSDRTYWQVYACHLAHITQLFENEEITAPFITVVGSLDAQTVQEAHAMLEGGHVKGKLVMVVE